MKAPSKLRGFFEPLGTYRYRAAYGGRGSAKSHTIARAIVMHAAMRKINILGTREVQATIKHSAKKLLDLVIDEEGLRSFFRSTDEGIYGANGTTFIFKGLWSDPDGIKSLEGIDLVWIEEAAPVSQKSLDILIPTIRAPGSEIFFSWNPENATAPVEKMFRGPDGPPPRTLLVNVNYNDNPWFPDELRAEMVELRRRDPVKARHVWDGEYLTLSEAQIFKNWRVEEFEAPAGSTFYFGADWGFAVDPTTLVRCHIRDKVLWIDYEAYAVGCDIIDTPALFDTVPRSRLGKITADSARHETISHMRKSGFRMAASVKGKGSVADGITFLQSFDIVVHPRCEHVIQELTDYKWRTDPRTDEIIPTPEDKNNHTIDALRYALERVKRGPRAFDGQNRKKRLNSPD